MRDWVDIHIFILWRWYDSRQTDMSRHFKLSITQQQSHVYVYKYKNTILCGMCFCHLAIKTRGKTLFMYYIGVKETWEHQCNFIIKYCARLNFFEGDELSYCVSSTTNRTYMKIIYVYTRIFLACGAKIAKVLPNSTLTMKLQKLIYSPDYTQIN